MPCLKCLVAKILLYYTVLISRFKVIRYFKCFPDSEAVFHVLVCIKAKNLVVCACYIVTNLIEY